MHLGLVHLGLGRLSTKDNLCGEDTKPDERAIVVLGAVKSPVQNAPWELLSFISEVQIEFFIGILCPLL